MESQSQKCSAEEVKKMIQVKMERLNWSKFVADHVVVLIVKRRGSTRKELINSILTLIKKNNKCQNGAITP